MDESPRKSAGESCVVFKLAAWFDLRQSYTSRTVVLVVNAEIIQRWSLPVKAFGRKLFQNITGTVPFSRGIFSWLRSKTCVLVVTWERGKASEQCAEEGFGKTPMEHITTSAEQL
jgi:hypothetical protein